MTIYALVKFYLNQKDSHLYAINNKALPFFVKRNIVELIRGVSNVIKDELTDLGFYTYERNEQIKCYLYRTVTTLAIVFATKDHVISDRTLRCLLQAITCDEVSTIEQLNEFLLNPDKTDKIGILQKDLADTVNATQDVFYKLMVREEKLYDLVMKSDQLSSDTKKFANGVKKMNRCCNIL